MEEIEILSGKAVLKGNLIVQKGSDSIIIFAHGSGSSRLSPRNSYVADEFNKAGFSTLLMDLLTIEEERRDMLTAQHRFDVDMLARRVISATEWVNHNPATSNFSVGYFGASTGAAAALIAAAQTPGIDAIVSRGGRPDLAMRFLPKVDAKVLLIVGGNDPEVIGMNKEALKHLNEESKLEVIEGATHLFEEPGKMEEVARLAEEWFLEHIGRG
ncbi:MAG TPA: dienelactone hydrolase family protein [Candidatus Nanoarchaeia archaeon]|nr:dienelactone hydrolase family protein [Candidatus Nanoarchaeia archaeon]